MLDFAAALLWTDQLQDNASAVRVDTYPLSSPTGRAAFPLLLRRVSGGLTCPVKKAAIPQMAAQYLHNRWQSDDAGALKLVIQ